jgi:hypothetical protein
MELFVDRMQIMDGEQEKSSDEQNVNFFTNDHPLLCAALAHFALVSSSHQHNINIVNKFRLIFTHGAMATAELHVLS